MAGRALLLVSVCGLSACSARPPTEGVGDIPGPAPQSPILTPEPQSPATLRGFDPVIDSPQTEWVEQTLAGLTLRQKAAQLFAPWISGAYLAVDSEAFDRLKKVIAEDGVGGVVISIGPPLEVASRINILQELAQVPLLITADMEHGPGQRLDGGIHMPWGLRSGGGTHFPPLMALGAANEEELAYQLGRITAVEARAVGIGMIFAPVVDLNNDPANPVINIRSYGADPELVSRLATAHIRGLQENGAYAVAKHFPGHGNTNIDSHISLPTISSSRRELEAFELAPFRAAIGAGVTGVMSAHITFPALTGDTLPATLSREVLTGLLQGELGFSGLVVSDALDMGAIVRRYGPGEAPLRAFEAGADLLLMPADLGRAIDAMVQAVESGRVTEARLDHSVRKLLRLKAGLGLDAKRTMPLEEVPHRVGTREDEQIAAAAAARSITLVKDRDNLVPQVAGARRALSILFTADPHPTAGRSFNQLLRPNFRSLRTVRIDPATSQARLDSIREEARGADVVFISTYTRVVTGKGTVAIPDRVSGLISAIAAERPTIVASFGNPYLIQNFPSVGTYLLAWGSEEVSERAAARAILGQAAITGRLPIEIPPHFPIGAGIERRAPDPSSEGHGPGGQ